MEAPTDGAKQSVSFRYAAELLSWSMALQAPICSQMVHNVLASRGEKKDAHMPLQNNIYGDQQ